MMTSLNITLLMKKRQGKQHFSHSKQWEFPMEGLQAMMTKAKATTLIPVMIRILLDMVKAIRINHPLTINRLLSLLKVVLQVFLVTRTFTQDPRNNELNQAKLNELTSFCILICEPHRKNLTKLKS